MSLTTNKNDPDLGHGADKEKVPQEKKYLILSQDERAKGFVRQVRTTYTHNVCGTETKMNIEIAETYARDPKFYGATYCLHCSKHLPVSEFKWFNGETVGS